MWMPSRPMMPTNERINVIMLKANFHKSRGSDERLSIKLKTY